MKRSEMINILSNYLYEHNLEPEEAQEEAEVLLNMIEKVGMLPPINNHDFYMDGDNADEKSVIYRTWEEE